MKKHICKLSIISALIGTTLIMAPVSGQSLTDPGTPKKDTDTSGKAGTPAAAAGPKTTTAAPASAGTTTTGGAPTTAPGAVAAGSTTATGNQNMAPIIVTGSYIPVTDTTQGPSPLQVISSDQIALRGDNTVSDVLQHLPENGSFSNRGIGAGNSFNRGAAFVSLKGLGPQATLVLVDGLRVAPAGNNANDQYAFTDLNDIPVGDIDHIEVLTDGASALYGSDAVAGVVNIILKKDLGDADAETSVFVGNTTDHDAFEQQYSQAFGLKSFDKNGDGVVVLNFYNRNAIFDRDRDYSNTANLSDQGGYDLRSARTFPGSFINPNPGSNFITFQGVGPQGTATVANENVTENGSGFFSGNVQGYDYAKDQTLIPFTSRYGAYLNYGYNFYNGDVRPNIEFNYQHIDTQFTFGPQGYFGSDIAAFPNGLPVPTTNFYNNTGAEQDLYSYRFVQLGDRTEHEGTDFFRVVPSIDFKLPYKWDMTVDMNYSYSYTGDVTGNEVSTSRFLAALASDNPATAFDPFSDSPTAGNSQAVLNNIRANDASNAYDSLLGQDIRLNGPIFDLPAGTIDMALGAENRIDRFNQNFSQENTSGDILSSSVQLDTAAARTVTSGYAEVHIPVLGKGFNFPGVEAFDVWGAFRVDSYNDFGTTINPEARFTLYPVKDLLIRGSFGTGFRAPSLQELFAAGGQSFETVSDPTHGTNSEEVLINTPGNPLLKPELSEAYNLGFVYSPSWLQTTSGEFPMTFNIHGDVFKIRYTDQILKSDAQTEIDEGSPLVHRNPQGDITSIDVTYANVASTLVQGIDEGFTYSIGDPNKAYGKFTADVNGTFYLTYSSQAGPGQPFSDAIGEADGGIGAFPRYRQETILTWDYRSFQYSISNDYISGVDDTFAIGPNIGGPTTHKIDAYSTFDMQASYTFVENKHDYYGKNGIDWMSWLDGTKVTFGCNNFLDARPPESLDPSDDPEGSDAAYADYRGRFLFGAITKTW